MSKEADPYEVLGVPRDADLSQVRTAYRKAALARHPDRYGGGSVEAECRLRELIAAYKLIARRLDPAQWQGSFAADGRAFTPRDFAREGPAAYWRPECLDAAAAIPSPAALGLMREEARPTRNETRTFAVLWAAAVVLGVAVGLVAALHRAAAVGTEQLTTEDIILSVLCGEAIYVALAAAAALLVVLTRKVIRLTLDLAGLRWRFLPGPARELPPGEPAHPSEP